MATNKTRLQESIVANLVSAGANTDDENIIKAVKAIGDAILDEITGHATVKSNSPYGCSAGGVTGYLESKIT